MHFISFANEAIFISKGNTACKAFGDSSAWKALYKVKKKRVYIRALLSKKQMEEQDTCIPMKAITSEKPQSAMEG